MVHDTATILSVLDDCCDAFTFPMLDNGYVHLAATRLALFRSEEDWAMVIEVFGFSPRAGLPDVCVYTFGSRLHDRNPPADYQTREAHKNYLTHNPHNESRFFNPVEEGTWQHDDFSELVSNEATDVVLRGRPMRLPALDEYARFGIELEDSTRVHVFELCRYLAAVERELVLATPSEQRVSVRPEMTRILQLEEWHHPDVVDENSRPSCSETFQQLAEALHSGDVSIYKPSMAPNTHWRNWPDGGTL